ncbi:MAG: hypothetical protein IJ436_01545 [Bacteroidaceae bacterium]|nr:hypothetical protein [Bacteroidaceae bacterium]
MRKIFVFILSVTAIVTGCDNGTRTKLQESNDSLKTIVAEKDATITDLLGTMNVIEEGFKNINEMLGRINTSSATSEVAYSDILKSNIDAITETLANNKREIEKLKKQVMSDKQASKELKTKIANLEKELMEKGNEIGSILQAIAEKNIHIEKLDSIITDLTRANTGQELLIMEQEQEINNVWYAIGTKSELKEQNILDSGEVMREKDINFGYFTRADKRELTTINTHAKRAKLLTNHPDGTYTLERNAEKQYILTITAPDDFWSASKYLVIQVR